MIVSEFLVLVAPAIVVSIASVSVFVMTVREHPPAGVLAFVAALAEITVALSWMGVLSRCVPLWLDTSVHVFLLSGPFFLFFASLLLVLSKNAGRRKYVPALSWGCFIVASAHTLFCYKAAEAMAGV
jgi:hypothetical protein